MIETLIPNLADRRILLPIFADSIHEAHRIAANKWGITLHDDRVRLNVGSIVACTIHNGGIWLALADAPDLNLPPRIPGGDYFRYTVFREPCADVYVLPENIADYRRAWRRAHHDLIGMAGEKYKRLRRPSQDTHSPGVLVYLERFLDERLPRPIYAA